MIDITALRSYSEFEENLIHNCQFPLPVGTATSSYSRWLDFVFSSTKYPNVLVSS